MECKVFIYTGDKPKAGTDAKVKIRFIGPNNVRTNPFVLDKLFRNDFERGQVDEFKVTIPSDIELGKVNKIELWRDRKGTNPSWYVDKIIVVLGSSNFVFPVFRWIKPFFHYIIQEHDTSLPQFDEEDQQRQMELQKKRKFYKLRVKMRGFPAQVSHLPDDERFSSVYRMGMLKMKFSVALDTLLIRILSGKWKDLASLRNIFLTESLPEPKWAEYWTQDSHFGDERVAGTNPVMISLCTEIPTKFGVTDEMVEPFLEGLTIEKAIKLKRLFIIDLEIAKDAPCTNPDLHFCAPIVLLFETKSKHLLPIAIQLYQEKGPKNPVFLPSDPPYTWLLAKMWYNNTDASVHQAVTHLGFTHLIMEGVWVVTHRHLSQSHPIFKLLAPHFLYLLAINSLGLDRLTSPGGWMDVSLNSGMKGTRHMIREKLKTWRMDIDGTIPEELKKRGLLETDVLTYYPYRDDAILLYNVVKTYVSRYVDLYYDSPDKLILDFELQAWAEELVKARDHGGCGIQGFPGDGKFTQNDQLVLVLTSIITICSMSHGAFNFGQYDSYAFSPNHPLLMRGIPPKDKTPRKERDIVDSLADKGSILNTLILLKILSEKATNSLGDFEVNYIFEPKALVILDQFKADLRDASQTIKARNTERHRPYEWLDPDVIPNSIGI